MGPGRRRWADERGKEEEEARPVPRRGAVGQRADGLQGMAPPALVSDWIQQRVAGLQGL